MGKTMNLAIRDTRQQILEIMNKSGLPVAVLSMVLHEVSQMADNALERALVQEEQQIAAEQAQKVEVKDN